MMRGALSTKVRKLHQAYYLPAMTPIATLICEEDSNDSMEENPDVYRCRTNRQWDGR